MADRIVIYHTASGPDVETAGEFLEAKAAERVEASEYRVADTREKQLRFKDIEWKKNGKTTWTWQNPLLRLVFTEYKNYDELFAEFSFNGVEHGCGGKVQEIRLILRGSKGEEVGRLNFPGHTMYCHQFSPYLEKSTTAMQANWFDLTRAAEMPEHRAPCRGC